MDSDIPTSIRVPPVVRPPATLSYQTPQELQTPAGWTNVEVFILAPEQQRSHIKVVIGVRMTCALALGVVLVVFMLYLTHGSEFAVQAIVAGLAVFVLAIFELISQARIVAKVKRSWLAFRLLVADQGIMRMDAGRPPVCVEALTITRIIEGWDDFRVLIGVGRRLLVPKRVVDLNRLRIRLEALHKIDRNYGLAALCGDIVVPVVLSILNLSLYFLGLWVVESASAVAWCLGLVMLTSGIQAWRSLRLVSSSWAARLMSLLLFIFPLFLGIRLLWILFLRP